MAVQMKMNAALIGGVVNTAYSGNVQVGADGLITVDVRDVPALLQAGAQFIVANHELQPIGACRAATAGRIVASTSLSNGTLTIANQPDVGRQLGLYVSPGSGTITAGQCALTYVANDGTNQTDIVPLASAAVFTTNTSKGVLTLTSAIITGLVGGTSPLVQINDTNSLALSVNPGFVDFQVTKAQTDTANDTIGTVASSAACITPNTTPNGTHTYAFNYSFNGPVT